MANYGRKTPAPGIGAPDRIRITAVEITLARDYIRGAGSKWTKPQIVSAADGMAWLIRELPGSASLLSKMLHLMEGHPDPVIAMGDVANLVRAQALDANILEAEDVPPLFDAANRDAAAAAAAAASTQAGGDAEDLLSTNWDVLAQSNSGSNSGSNSSSNGGSSSGSSSVGPNGKVSDNSSSSAPSLAAPVQFPHNPHTGSSVDGDGGEVVDVGANGSGVARGDDVGDGDANVRNRDADRSSGCKSTSSQWRPRVCNRVWKGKTCNNRTNGCRFAHPTPCSRGGCVPTPNTGCRAFHPRVARVEGNGKGDVRKGGAVPKGKKKKDNRSSRPNHKNASNGRGRARRGGGGGSSNGSSSNNDHNGSSSNSSNSQSSLQRRVSAMEARLSGMREKRPSYRDVAAGSLGVHPVLNSSNGSSSNGGGGLSGGDYALARPDPATLSAVVSAVMAVLSGGQHF